MPESKKPNNSSNDKNFKNLLEKMEEALISQDEKGIFDVLRVISEYLSSEETQEILNNIPFILERLKHAYSLASDPNASEETLADMFELFKFYNNIINEEKFKIVLPEELIKELNSHITKIKEALEKNPNTPEDILKDIIFINIRATKDI